jgi:hypothetical protein
LWGHDQKCLADFAGVRYAAIINDTKCGKLPVEFFISARFSFDQLGSFESRKVELSLAAAEVGG